MLAWMGQYLSREMNGFCVRQVPSVQLEQFYNGPIVEHMSRTVAAAREGTSLPRVGIFLTSGLLLVFVCCGLASAQSTAGEDKDSTAKTSQAKTFDLAPVHVKSLPKNLFFDQKDFWSAPLHFSEKQWDWALPSILVGGLLIKADGTIEQHVPTSKSTVSHGVTYSNAGVAVLCDHHCSDGNSDQIGARSRLKARSLQIAKARLSNS